MDIKDAVSILIQIVESHQITVQGKQLAIAAQALQRATEFVNEQSASAADTKKPS